ncbi:MAG: DUF983 domain-containing protein [Actinomycetota bacterium]|nr:DUF983 domain-containing protein [Actinomycetota bacterium]
MLWRGVTKRCPVCGSGGLFERWFRMKEWCPRCGYRFEREEGFFLGAIVVNLAVAEALMALLCIVPVIYLSATRPEASLWPVIAGGIVAAVVAPLFFYPFSKTIWVALELMLRPAGSHEPTDNR